MNKEIKKSDFIKEITAGGTVKEIASRLGISTAVLREGAKNFNVNLRAKPKNLVIFIDDTVESEQLNTSNQIII